MNPHTNNGRNGSNGAARPGLAIMGVAFDNVTLSEAIERIEQMVASRRPHYFVTPNVDFLVQAREDIELRQILCEAHLVLCDGTPLVWASRLLGNPLPERVAGADLVPRLLSIAAEKGYRIFLLGATPESAQKAVTNLNARYPRLRIAGHYSPPFNTLLEMDHAEIARRIQTAVPDILLVSLGCPKQEKWMAMHYRALGVPVTAGVGATVDFLGGEMRRAPLWMQRSGLEWLFRLLQEPRRLWKRYVKDFWVFGTSLLAHWWRLHARVPPNPSQTKEAGASVALTTREEQTANGQTMYQTGNADDVPARDQCISVRLPKYLDLATVRQDFIRENAVLEANRDLLLLADQVAFVDSTGIGLLVRLRKKLRNHSRELVLVAPSPILWRALKLMRLLDLFTWAPDLAAAGELLASRALERVPAPQSSVATGASLVWRGEITAVNAEPLWRQSLAHFSALPPAAPWTIDLSGVRFMDSTGLGLMVRAKKLAQTKNKCLTFENITEPVRNVLHLARLEPFLLDHAELNRSTGRDR